MVIKFKGVTKEYPDGTRALDKIDFKIKPSDFVFIVGPTGAGKTTLVKLLIREELPTAGEIFVGELAVTKLSRSKLPFLRRKIGVAFQDYKLLPTKTAFENVALALEVLGKGEKEIETLTLNVLRLVNLFDRANLFPGQLSGGEKQKLSIARAMVSEPEILVADEPTGNIDPTSSWEVMELLNKINEWGTTVLVATHNTDIVNSLKRRVIALEKGRIVRDDKKGKYTR